MVFYQDPLSGHGRMSYWLTEYSNELNIESLPEIPQNQYV